MDSKLQKKKFNDLLRMVTECHYICINLYHQQEAKHLEKLLTSKEIVSKYCISNRTLQRFRTTGKLVPIARGKYYLYQEQVVESFFKSYRDTQIYK